jgi:hypothetical protein
LAAATFAPVIGRTSMGAVAFGLAAAVVSAGQAGYPYATGRSRTVRIRVG